MVKRRNIQAKRHRGSMDPTKLYQYSIDKELESIMNDSSILGRSPSSSIDMRIEDLPEPDLSRISDLPSLDRSSSDPLIDMKSLPSLDLSTKHALDEVFKKEERPRRFKKSKKKKKKIRIISGQVEKKKREERGKTRKRKRKRKKEKEKKKKEKK